MEGVSGQSWKRHSSLPPIFHVRAQSLDPSACKGGQGILPMSSGIKEMELLFLPQGPSLLASRVVVEESVGPWVNAPKLFSIMR